MIVNIETTFAVDYDAFIEQLNKPAAWMHVSAPLLSFAPLTPGGFPSAWGEGEYLAGLRLFGLIPLGKQAIVVERIKTESPDEYILRDNGSGDIVTRWDHWVLIRRRRDGKSIRYIDRVDIKAGILTFGVYLFASLFYRWRQHKWRRLIRNGFRNEKLK